MALVQDGKSCCTVVIARDADEKVKAAAEDFCFLLRRMTGAECPIKTDDQSLTGGLVCIGPSRLTTEMGIHTPTGRFSNERVILKRDGNRLVLLGNDDNTFTGTQFAVTMFFERLGCGWFGPDELWQVIPERKDLSIGYLDIDHTPAFISRYNNVLRNNPEVGTRWYLGGVKRMIGHCLTTLVPRDEYFETHPEWFCLVDGKRNPFLDWWQYCYSNEELLRTFTDKILTYFDQNPDVNQFSIAMNDGWYGGWCECEECRKLGTNSETVIWFANRLAREVGKVYPNHILTFPGVFSDISSATETDESRTQRRSDVLQRGGYVHAGR